MCIRDRSDLEQRAYAMGAINGMLIAPMFEAPKGPLRWLETCAEHMTDDQVAAIIRQHLVDHPERWYQGLHIESWVAMKNACVPASASPTPPARGGTR